MDIIVADHDLGGAILIMILRAVVGILGLALTVGSAHATPPEWEPIRRALLTTPKINEIVLCAPVSFSLIQLADVGLGAQGRLTPQTARRVLWAEAGYRLGYLTKQEGLNRVFSPTPKLTSLPKAANRDNCYVVSEGAERRNAEFVESHKLKLGTTEARLVLFKYEAKFPPLTLEYAKSVHAIRKDGLLKGRCVVTYDPFKKEWRSNATLAWCDFADIDSEFLDTRLEQGYQIGN